MSSAALIMLSKEIFVYWITNGISKRTRGVYQNTNSTQALIKRPRVLLYCILLSVLQPWSFMCTHPKKKLYVKYLDFTPCGLQQKIETSKYGNKISRSVFFLGLLVFEKPH